MFDAVPLPNCPNEVAVEKEPREPLPPINACCWLRDIDMLLSLDPSKDALLSKGFTCWKDSGVWADETADDADEKGIMCCCCCCPPYGCCWVKLWW